MSSVMHTIPIEELELGGLNAPVNDFDELVSGAVPNGHATRLQKTLDEGIPLDALVVARGTSALVVSLHGAIDRATTRLPRFERLRMLLEHNVSLVCFGDPTLQLSEGIPLAWYTGWRGLDVHAEIAYRLKRIAEMLGASKIILTGSSGGGFAALQISSFIEGSVALAFNAQTSIAEYRVDGVAWGVQRGYVQTVWDDIWQKLDPPGRVEDGAWVEGIEDRVSAVKRYSSKVANRTYIVQNEEEFHYREHFLPFLAAALAAGNDVLPSTNREGTRHNPPHAQTFHTELSRVLELEAPSGA